MAEQSWTAALDGLHGLSTAEKGKARVLLLRKSQEEASLLVSGLPDVAAEAIKEILRQEGAAADLGTTRAGAAAGLGVGSAAGAEMKLYNNVTVFVPGYATPYAKLEYQYLTKNEFVKQMERERYFRVVTVAEQPSQPLALEECTANSVDISEVQLQDDVKLAVVVGAEHALHKVQEQVKTIKGWNEGRINKDEYKAAEWATMHIAGDMGASRWCFKEISGLVDADKLKIEIDGMAFSLERVVLVERKPRIKLMYVQELADKIWKLMKLVAAGAPNTDMLRDRFRPEIKPLEVFLMADGWVDDPGEAAACAVRMEEAGIAPLLPTGDGGYDARDSCGRWPVDDGIRRRGQDFLANKPGRRRPKRSGSSAATDASGSSGAGGSAGPNSAVGGQRHASSSQQQAACSPAQPAHHLRTHDPFSATSGVWLQRRVAPVCRPLHPPPLHPPCHHHYSMPSVRRL